MKVMILFWVLRNRFLAIKFRNNHNVTHSSRWKGIRTCQELRLLHFVKFSSLETTFWRVYGQITKILTEWKIVKWSFLLKQARPRRLVFTYRCKNTRRIVWNRFRSWGRLVWQLKGRFSRNFSQKSHFWRVKNGKNNFSMRFSERGLKIT